MLKLISFVSCFYNVATKKFKTTLVAHILFLLNDCYFRGMQKAPSGGEFSFHTNTWDTVIFSTFEYEEEVSTG